MLSNEEFVERAFAIAADMTKEPAWAHHVLAVDGKYIRFKNGKNVDAESLSRMFPALLKVDLQASSANPVINAATKNQSCVNVPVREIVRRMREALNGE